VVYYLGRWIDCKKCMEAFPDVHAIGLPINIFYLITGVG
jgi:hypothetical protein